MYTNGLDGMRYLGADPTRAADDVERITMGLVNDLIVRELDSAASSD